MAGAKPRGRRRGGRDGGEVGEEVSEYERQRQERIRENKERLECLGLTKLSSSLQSRGRERHGEGNASAHGEETGGRKRGVRRDRDEEYRPSDESSEDAEEEEEEKGKRGSSSGSRRTQKQKRKNEDVANGGSPGKKLIYGSDTLDLDGVDKHRDEVSLQMVMAPSLGEPVLSARSPNSCGNFPNNSNLAKGKQPETSGRGRRRKGDVRRVQITEDEAIAYFFMLDESGKGNVALHDLRKMASTHDFSWSEKEMTDMIHCFDSDGDKRLNFNDFHNILSRCNMLQESKNPLDG